MSDLVDLMVKGKPISDLVDLSERVTATYYDDEHEEWSQKTVTIADVLDSVCDDYTVLPSAQPEWSNHTVACLLAELFGDACACNYNGIDEWLPEKCELLDSCPNPGGVACWEQFLKHKAERRTDG